MIAQHVGIVPYNNPVFRVMMSLANTIVVRPMPAGAERVAFFSEITARYFSGLSFRRTPKLMFTGVDTRTFFPIRPEQKPELRARLGLMGWMAPERHLCAKLGMQHQQRDHP